jgi:hypothetical protein
MALTAAQLQQILNQATAESGGKFHAFDPVFYANAYSDSINLWLSIPGNAGKSLLQHYVEVGSTQGYWTSAAFNPQFYFAQWPDLQSAGLSGSDLLAHWVTHGIAEGRAATAEALGFDGARYLAEYPDVAAYVNAHLGDFLGSASNGALGHFIKFGAAEGREAFSLSGQAISLTEFPAFAPITFAGGVLDIDTNGGVTTLTKAATVADGATTDGVLRLSGDAEVRIDFTHTQKQISGIDLNGRDSIESNGVENNIAGTGILTAKNFTIVDAYARNPLNQFDDTHNFLGNINYDGTGFAGDGTKTNGNIFLGGLGTDTAFGGIGNDFLAGGGSASGDGDNLRGGRNADFFFAELSLLSATDGTGSSFDGGTTADNTTVAGVPLSPVNPAGGLGTQDNDWLLLEASDDDEPVTVSLSEGQGSATTRAGAGVGITDFESVNASGNLYGFLDKVNTVVGARAYDGYSDAYQAGAENYGRGSTAQLIITGSAANNAIVGGYDNDSIAGGSGDDLLMGGDLQFLINHKNNPNILDKNGGLNLTANAAGLVFDGRDALDGGDGNDDVVFEADGGSVSGGADTGKTSGRSASPTDDRNYDGPRFASQGDNLWLTNFSTGRLAGATAAGEATAQADALAKSTTDSTVRIDLGTGDSFRNYGGAVTTSQDTTNYATGAARTTVSGMESVNATGLGAIDYKAAGLNSPDLAFNNVQNYFGLNANLDLRGTAGDNALLANTGSDTLEGRGGDDVLSGGAGKDTFVESFGDGVEWIARPVDANNDNIWDTTGGLVVAGGLAWGRDFRAPAAPTAGQSTLVVDFGTTILDGATTFVATFQVNIDGTEFGTSIPATDLAAAKSTAEVAAIVNAVYHAADKNVSVVATSPTTIEVRVVDATPGDGTLPVISTTPADGFFVAGSAPGAGNTFSAKGSILGKEGTNVEDDRLIIKSYDDRAINLGLDQTKYETSQAAGMVANFAATGSQLAESQGTRLYLDRVREGDTVSVTINGQQYSYTVKAGQNAENAAVGLATAINNFLDIDSASGTVTATADAASFGDSKDTGDQQAGVLVRQANVLNSQAFMNLTATVTRADGATPFGSIATHNQSNTFVAILGFDGRDGQLTAADATPVVLFQGRNTGTTTTSLLATAKDAGETLTGTSATQSALPAGNWINGDDLLYGGKGNDTLVGATGDDRFIMSGGNDTVYGDNLDGTGSFDLEKNGTTRDVYQDVLQAEEATFGTGTRFNVSLDGTLYKNGVGKVLALDSTGTTVATTDFSGIELVRVLENNRSSSLDLKALSDSVATAVGNDSLPTEGLFVALTRNPSTIYQIDRNGDGVITFSTDPAKNEVITATAVLGTENLTTGNANDTATLDQTQATANNVIDLGAQQDNTVLATLREGADRVIYDHRDVNNDGKVVNTAAALSNPGPGTITVVGGDPWNLAGFAVGTVIAAGTSIPSDAALRPTLTVEVDGASSSQVAMTGGALGTATFTDTLKNVEVVDISLAATSSRHTDVVDLSKLAGATVNYGAAETVGKSVGGALAPVDTVAKLDANTLDSGGVALTGNALGTELVTIAGIAQLETVTGSSGNDRVIVANTFPTVATDDFASKDGLRITVFDYNPTNASGVNATPAARADQGLYQWNLGAGSNDVVDYKQETGFVVVSVDTSSADKDLIWVDSRVDSATGVERYFGGSGGNWIDLGAATVATTIQFSKEAKSNTPANEFADPAGNDGTTTDGLTRTAEVRSTADNTVFASFVDRTGTGTVTTASLWQTVFGSSKAETVLLTDNETAAAHQLYLLGGANKVDYSALTTTITAQIGSTNTALKSLEQITIANGDQIEVTRAPDPATNSLTIAASSRAGDQIDVSLLQLGAAVASTGDIPNTSQVDPQFHLVDLSAGVVTESVFGQYTPVGAPVGTAVARGFQTFVTGFENASNAGDPDLVHLLGDNGRNALAGGTAADLIYGARGTAGDGTADVLAGNRGDQLTGNAGADVFLYKGEAESPGGTIAGNQQLGSNFNNNAFNVTNSIDTITDFTPGTDKLAFVINDAYESVRANGAVPANLGLTLNAVTAVVATFAAGDTKLDIAHDVTAAQIPNRVDNYDINNAGTATRADLILRVNATSGADVIDASAGLAATALNAASADGLRVDLVYTAASQSQAGGFDQVVHFATGSDKIDLSFLQLPRFEISHAGNGVDYDTNDNQIVDALEGNAIRSLGAAPVFAVNSSAPNMFFDAGIYKPIATQTLADGNGDPSTTIFIDVDGNGNYDTSLDMAVVLVGVNAPVTGDFIFGQYGGGWGG